MATVSVIIPNYNHAPYLAKRIESVLNQTYRDIEVLLMDDCSTDNSRDIIDRYARSDARVRLLLNQVNGGNTFKQWNKGVRESRGELVWLAESDDYADPQFLETLVNRLSAAPGAVLAYSQSWNVNEHDQVLGSWKTHTDDLDADRFAADFYMKGEEYIRNFLVYKNTILNASAVVFRRSKYLEAGGADEKIRVSSDWRFWIKLLQRGDLLYVSRELNYYRSHQNTVRASAVQSGIHVLEHLKMIAFVFEQVKVAEAAKKQLLKKADALTELWFKTATFPQVMYNFRVFASLAKIDRAFARLVWRLVKKNHLGISK